jgi:hypothetical protein
MEIDVAIEILLEIMGSATKNDIKGEVLLKSWSQN